MSPEKNNGGSQGPDERGRQNLEWIVGVVDQRVKAFFDQNWQTLEGHLIEKLSEGMAPQLQAFIERRAKQIAAGGGGGNGTGHNNGNGGGGDGGADFLANMPDEPEHSDAETRPRYQSVDERKAAAVSGLLAIIEDPVSSIERLVDIGIKVADRRKAPTAQVHPFDQARQLAEQYPELISLFSPQDPELPAGRIGEAMMAGAKWGLDVAGVAGKASMRDLMKKKAPPWTPQGVEKASSAPSDDAGGPSSSPEPEMATAAQPRRRRRSLREMA